MLSREYSFNSATSTLVSGSISEKVDINLDIDPQKPLQNPPATINAIYLTSWAASTENFVDYAIDLAANTEINAVVIDVKDYSGMVTYDTEVLAVNLYKAKEVRIPKINSLIKRLHDKNIYVIARISVFQDQALPGARPDLAVQSISLTSSTTDKSKWIWLDRKKLAWADPASREVWDYNISIAKDAAARGFDELNFDYIRFPSDGDLKDAHFPAWDETRPRSSVISEFFSYLRTQIPDVRLSADLFGLVTLSKDDLGIGQIIEDAYAYFDFVAPMVYPSHYAAGSMGFANPADHPYEVVKNSIDSAHARLTITSSSVPFVAKLRPWLQDFNLGATYDSVKVSAQIRAVRESLGNDFSGYMLWSPSNKYTRDALGVEF